MQRLENIMQAALAAKHERPAWIEVDMAALRANFAEIKRVAGACPITAVIKANAYGHGAVPVAQCLLAEGAANLAVATLGEALELRASGITAPIMLLSPIDLTDSGALLAFSADIAVPVFSYAAAAQMNAALEACNTAPGQKLDVQLVLDTGMGRIGFADTEPSVEEIKKIARLPKLHIAGMFSHFATADEADKAYAKQQLARFNAFAAALAEAGIDVPRRHLANSAALMEVEAAHMDTVRAGIILYGYYPSAEVDKSIMQLTPVMSIKAKITWVKDVPAGTSVSYGRTYITPAPARIATIPVGYADGWSRLQSNNGFVLVGGRRCPIIGRVCMDQFMVDVTGLDISAGEEAVLLGRQGAEKIDAEEIAARCGTISYEVLSSLLPRLPRKYLHN